MFKKIINIFKWKKSRFRDSIKKEKSRFYMFRNKKSTNFYSRKKSNQFQLKFNYKINKKAVLFFILWVLIISLSGIIYVFNWNYFSIQKIKISINDSITDENIAYKSIDSIRNKSIFLESNETINKKLLDYQKNIKSVQIKRLLPDTLEINISSYPIVLDIIYAERQYSLTSNWVVVPFKKNKKSEEKNILSDWNWKIILNIAHSKEDKYKILSYKKFFKPENVEQIFILINSFKNNILDLKIEKVNLFRKEKELHIFTKNKTTFIFSLEEDVSQQLKNLLVYKKWEKSSLRQIYIDLRVKNKIFICPYTSEYQCRRNLKRIYE